MPLSEERKKRDFCSMNLHAILLFLLLCPLLLCGQGNTTPVAEVMAQAEVALANKELGKAERLYRRAVRMVPTMAPAHRGLGLVCELQKDFDCAAKNYATALEHDSLFSRALYYEAGIAHYKAGSYPQALQLLTRYDTLAQLPTALFGYNGQKEAPLEAAYLRQLPSTLEALRVTMDSLQFVNLSEVVNLGRGINTSGDEYFPCLSHDRKLLFYTARVGPGADENIYQAEGSGSSWRGRDLVPALHTELHEGMPTLSRDGRQLFFTACEREAVDGACDIRWARYQDGEVSGVHLPIGINSTEWDSQAAATCDARRIYFASTRPGGFGGSDLWYTDLKTDGNWTTPVNMGPKINTPDDEEAPYITNDGRSLYFSSNGHLGLGGTDVFVCWFNDATQQWGIPINIGPPVNSPHNELGFFLTTDGKTGLFASDRPGGFGRMDIYTFELSKQLYSEPITLLEGYVVDDMTGKPVTTEVLLNGQQQLRTDSMGRFFLCAGADEVLDLQVEHQLYLPFQQSYPIPEWNNKRYYVIELPLDPVARYLPDAPTDTERVALTPSPNNNERNLLHNVFFGFDSAQLTPKEAGDLTDFLKSHSGNIQKIEVIGYTDPQGNDDYNLRLSEKRAKSIALFLMDRGLMVDKFFLEGQGAVANNEQSEAYQRRVEVKIWVLE